MTNLDYVISGARTYDEAAEQFDELLSGLYQLDRDHPTPLTDETTVVKTETLNEILTAYRKLTA